MRFTVLLGVGAVVAIIAVIAFVSFRGGETAVVEETPQPDGGLQELPGNGQYLQEIPGGAAGLPVSSTTPATTTAAENTGTPTPASAKATITISESGFSPETITIASGTTVTFVNNGQAAHWPAADSHPTHQSLPGFDAKRGLGTGESYSYTFTQAGTWQCHDHLMPQNECAIVVE